jgi:hypothetical protein
MKHRQIKTCEHCCKPLRGTELFGVLCSTCEDDVADAEGYGAPPVNDDTTSKPTKEANPE